ncbi:aldo-keto reductase 1B-like isoform X1 [Tubulanus polymorphus]|uniref:aldo-keto reductase 1B-like isoform X1 n=1 Tax=Tubulanus polymorphus TaxID=672921 RepID=UPI003DA3F4D9
MSIAVKSVTIANGVNMPVLGLGTWQSVGGECEQVVKDAIDCGYRHIDTATLYMNEKEVGCAISAKIKDGTVKREDLFITTKLWNTFHRKDLVLPSLKESMNNLQLEYLDLFLIHWPMAFKEGKEIVLTDKDGNIMFSDVPFIDTWKEMEKAVNMGLVKAIGVSNFNSKQVQMIIDEGTIKPANIQVECHPYFNNSKLMNFCRERNISVTAYSPFGSPQRGWQKDDEPLVIADERLKPIAEKHGKTPAQVVLRYIIQRGAIAIPKSVTRSRIEQNINVFDFELSEDEMKVIDSFEQKRRIAFDWGAEKHRDYPFHEEF